MSGKLLLGTLGALAGAVAGALIWAGITVSTNFQIGYMAVGVGFLAGIGMRLLGGGRERIDGFVAGAVAFLGCVLGNLLTVVFAVAQHEHESAATTVYAAIGVLVNPPLAWAMLRDGFNAMDVLFYAIAVYAGYRTALKPPANAAAASAHASTEEPTPNSTP